jgi:hypothetical protein
VKYAHHEIVYTFHKTGHISRGRQKSQFSKQESFEPRSSSRGVGESSPSEDRLDEFRYLNFNIIWNL